MKINEAATLAMTFVSINHPVMLWGSPGIGKSSVVKQIKDKLTVDTGERWGLVDYRASTRDNVSVMGTPDIHGETTRWRVPDEFPQEARDGKNGILFLDEINTADKPVLRALLGLVLDRWVGDYRLPDGWVIVAAGNLQTDRTGVTAFPRALSNRFAHINVEPDADAAVQYMASVGVDPMVTSFLRWRPALIHDMSGTDQTFPTPRNWEVVNRLLPSVSDASRLPAVTAVVGDGPAAEFEAFVRTYRDLPSLDLVLSNPLQAKLPTSPAGQFAITSGLSRKVQPQTLANAIAYLERVGREYVTAFMMEATNRDPGLSHSPEFVKWASDAENQADVNISA